MDGLVLDDVHKRYADGTHAVRGVSVAIEPGEFAVLVGPSGCGKSTLLRAIAGLESVTAGDIRLHGASLRDLPPRARNLAMVFQSYALYPYLSVFENIAFGLRARKVAGAEVDRRVRDAAERLGLVEHLERRPRELSGGQRQRVAIGRAIVRDAELFLFDEPLSNLDAQLREEMREEIKRLHQRLGKTFVYVTHDQIEAMTLADRIVLLRDGRVEQCGPPMTLYEAPATRFVAGFLGSPAMNQLAAVASPARGGLVLADDQVLPLEPAPLDRLLTALAPPSASGSAGSSGSADASLVVGVRPQDLHPVAAGGGDLHGTVAVLQPTGSRVLASVMLGETRLIAELPASIDLAVGEPIALEVERRRLLFFADGGARLDVET